MVNALFSPSIKFERFSVTILRVPAARKDHVFVHHCFPRKVESLTG